MQRFVLIDAYPGMADKVQASLAKYPQVRRHRLLREQNIDLVAIVDGEDPDAIADYVAGTLRFVDGVYTVRVVDEAEELPVSVRKAMKELSV